MTLLDILKLIDGNEEYFPLEEDERGHFDTRPNSAWNVTICFMCEEETWLTCNIQNEILVPWWDCEVKAINPDDEHKDSICIWLKDSEYIKKNYPQHVIKCVENKKPQQKGGKK